VAVAVAARTVPQTATASPPRTNDQATRRPGDQATKRPMTHQMHEEEAIKQQATINKATGNNHLAIRTNLHLLCLPRTIRRGSHRTGTECDEGRGYATTKEKKEKEEEKNTQQSP
jgi:hypothetical protein